MALQEDQRAMLQLLLEREQSYADIASLLGDEEDDVRSRAREALAELAGTDPDHEVGLSDYLLGQADPIGRADAARHLKEDPDDRELAAKLIAQLQLIAPDAELPKLPAAPKRARRAKPVAAEAPDSDAEEEAKEEDRTTVAGRRLPSLPSLPSGADENRTRLMAILAGAGVLVLIGVLAITGVIGGGGDDESTASSDTSAQEEEALSGSVRVPLVPATGGDAAGVATVGQATADQVFIELDIRELEPAPAGKTYFVWFGLGGDRGYPFVPLQMPASGEFNDRFPLPQEYVNVLAGAKSIDVWLSDNQQVVTNIQDAIKKTEFVSIPGEPILEGDLTTQTGGGAGAEVPGGAGGQVPGGGAQIPGG
jgi:hypothetical protein